MSALLQATLHRKSKSFVAEVAQLKTKTQALQRQYPDKQLITGRRDEGDKVHVVVMLGKAAKANTAAAAANYVVSF